MRAERLSNDKPGLYLRWTHPEIRGWVDFIPLEQFLVERESQVLSHLVFASKKPKARAKCLFSLVGKEALLNYEAFPKFNNEQDMALGILRVVFSDTRRMKVHKVWWKPEGEPDAPAPIDRPALVPFPPAGKYEPPKKGTKPKKEFAHRKERPGQQRLRARLIWAYGSCCLSGTRIPEALEAAHLDPVINHKTDNPKNALLLRRDLHRMFDQHLISVAPDSGLVHLAPSVRADATYRALHRSAKIRRPNDSSCQPDAVALKRHWEAFSKKWGSHI